jgi:tryptophan synthase beta chain
VVQHARRAREANERTVILFNLSGHGIFDLSAYDSFLSGRMTKAA